MIKNSKFILNQSDKEKITQALSNHGVIAFPTDTVWGLGANPLDEIAIKKILKLRKLKYLSS